MQRLRDRLPPANSLIVFEYAARQLSFTRAAEELRVTQAAVSRQVQLLEAHLGVRLFTRRHRAIALTPEGQHFQQAVSIGLAHIAGAADELRREQDAADVTLEEIVTSAASCSRLNSSAAPAMCAKPIETAC